MIEIDDAEEIVKILQKELERAVHTGEPTFKYVSVPLSQVVFDGPRWIVWLVKKILVKFRVSVCVPIPRPGDYRFSGLSHLINSAGIAGNKVMFSSMWFDYRRIKDRMEKLPLFSGCEKVEDPHIYAILCALNLLPTQITRLNVQREHVQILIKVRIEEEFWSFRAVVEMEVE